MKRIVAIFLSFFALQIIAAQPLTHRLDTLTKSFIADTAVTKTYTIGKVFVTGNKRTRPHIILRELTFKTGDTVTASVLAEKIHRSKELVYNTGLFVEDSIKIISKEGNVLNFEVVVKERWYVFPLPYVRPVDRNLNQWLIQEGASLDRVNYGVKLTHNNLTGQNDKLNIWLISGYNQQLSVRYNLPFIDKSLTKGFEVGYTTSRQHELKYMTSDSNKQLFLKLPNDYARSFTRFDFTYSYRPDQKKRHLLRIAYTNEMIADSVFVSNPNYYPDNRTEMKYVDFLYAFRYLNTDYFVYPTKGFMGEVSVYKRGLESISNLWQVALHGVWAKHLNEKTFGTIEAATTVKFPFNDDYYTQPLFGYGYFQLRGQEYYVVDGMFGALGKFTLTHSLFNYTYHNPIKSKTHDLIPFRFYVKAFFDMGYAYNPNVTSNLLNNKFMYTYGVGMDILSIYDLTLKITFAINQLGNKGLYLHARNDF